MSVLCIAGIVLATLGLSALVINRVGIISRAIVWSRVPPLFIVRLAQCCVCYIHCAGASFRSTYEGTKLW